MTALDLIAAIEERIRPGTETYGVYNCCGCSTYDDIIDDIEELIRELLEDVEEPDEGR